jgi:hypothetical protein
LPVGDPSRNLVFTAHPRTTLGKSLYSVCITELVPADKPLITFFATVHRDGHGPILIHDDDTLGKSWELPGANGSISAHRQHACPKAEHSAQKQNACA